MVQNALSILPIKQIVTISFGIAVKVRKKGGAYATAIIPYYIIKAADEYSEQSPFDCCRGKVGSAGNLTSSALLLP